MEQITLFSTQLRINNKDINCRSCACGAWNNSMYGNKPCEYLERGNCPEAAKRTGTNPDPDIYTDERYHNKWCVGCARYLPIPGTNCHNGNWRGYEQHRFFCPSYMESTAEIKQCLKYPITVYKSDNHMICPVCDAQGCEECYKQFEEETE